MGIWDSMIRVSVHAAKHDYEDQYVALDLGYYGTELEVTVDHKLA